MSVTDSNIKQIPLDFSGFDVTERETWLKKIERDLKIPSVEVLEKNFEGYFQITPFADATYLKEQHITPIVLPNTDTPFLIAEAIPFLAQDIQKTNTVFLEALIRGVQTPVIFLDSVLSGDDFSKLFNGVACEYIFTHLYDTTLNFDTIEKNLDAFASVQKMKKDFAEKKIHGAINISYTVFSRMTKENFETLSEKFSKLLPEFYFFCLDAAKYFPDNRNAVEQIAQFCKELNVFFSVAELKNIPLDFVARKMRVRVSVGTNFYIEIAKLRAIKIVIANLLKAWGIPPLVLPLDVVVIPAYSEKSTHQNKISATTQILSAYLGGANTVLTLSNNTTDFDTRILTNIQHVLQLESGIPQINDPAAGSYYIEQLTHKMGEAAWEMIQQ